MTVRVGMTATPIGHRAAAALFAAVPAVSWMADGLCQQVDPELFFPNVGGSARDAKMICAKCPVIKLCLQYALEHGPLEGVWGGKSPEERKNLKRRRGRPVSPPLPCGSEASARAHYRRGEPIDDACREAHREANAARRLRATPTDKRTTAA